MRNTHTHTHTAMGTPEVSAVKSRSTSLSCRPRTFSLQHFKRKTDKTWAIRKQAAGESRFTSRSCRCIFSAQTRHESLVKQKQKGEVARVVYPESLHEHPRHPCRGGAELWVAARAASRRCPRGPRIRRSSRGRCSWSSRKSLRTLFGQLAQPARQAVIKP
jgi:hypothetical protein